MKKIGRPSLPLKKRRSRNLQIRLTDEEYKKIEKRAQQEDQQVSNWARKSLLDLKE